MRPALPAVLLPWVLLLLPGAGAPAQEPEECPRGRIAYVFIDNHSIFDLAQMDEDAPFRWAYETANALHMETRAEFLSAELLFRVGECYDPFLLAETERILRSYPFIARSDVFGVPQPDGSRHVVVDTQDEWTTKLDLGMAFDEGFKIEKVELTEENFLGRGILAGVFFRERRERQDAGFVFETPRLLGTRWDARLSAGRSRVGDFVDQGFFYPFVGEVGRTAARQVYRSRESIFPYSVPEGMGFSHVLLPFHEESMEVTVAGRLGRPGNLTVFGIGFLRESLEFNRVPDELEVAVGGDFSNTEPAGQEVADRVSGQVRAATISRLNFLVGQRNVRFVQRRGLDALTGIQDVRLGTELNLTVGRSLGDVASGDRDAPDDLYARLGFFGARQRGDALFSSSLNVEARRLFGEGESASWRDILAEMDAYVYWQPGGGPGHTFLGRISATGGWSVERPYQLSLGGRSGVRGYSESDFPGGRRVVLTIEDRILVDWPAPDLLDFGFTVFGDVGRIWAGDVPFGGTVGWKAAVGGGLRIGFPAGSRGVLRADLAVPVSRPGRFTQPVFRVSLVETLGLRRGFADEELLRSRRPGVGADLLAQEPR